MQDDYNRFIRRSIMQAQCNYEDIFRNDAQGESCGCGGVMPNTDSAACGCNKTMSDMDDDCGCGCNKKLPDTDSAACGCNKKTPVMDDDCGCEVTCTPKCDRNVPVMAFVEMQPFGRMYNEAEGLCRGTIFPALDKPFTGRGGCR